SHFHQYINPHRAIDAGAIEVHGITSEFLEDKPCFADIHDEFIEYIRGAELVIHNAPFDVGFLNHEFGLCQSKRIINDISTVLDTLTMARHMHPGQKNSLDALCKRYEVNNTQRDLHGALLDAEILADVYLAMTGGQVALSLDDLQNSVTQGQLVEAGRIQLNKPLRVIHASEEELIAHEQRLKAIRQACNGELVWDKSSEGE
ncbi:MAG: DNA polymerase III subunit epsilon, partial [Gammaproteobacteria bacterium]